MYIYIYAWKKFQRLFNINRIIVDDIDIVELDAAIAIPFYGKV